MNDTNPPVCPRYHPITIKFTLLFFFIFFYCTRIIFLLGEFTKMLFIGEFTKMLARKFNYFFFIKRNIILNYNACIYKSFNLKKFLFVRGLHHYLRSVYLKNRICVSNLIQFLLTRETSMLSKRIQYISFYTAKHQFELARTPHHFPHQPVVRE